MLSPNLKLWRAVATALLFRGFAVDAAPMPVYENRGEASSPQIDATVFLNRGTFAVSSGDLPYQTQNTLAYTNFAGATISGSRGFWFDLVDTNGLHRPSAHWVNQGTISFSAPTFSFGFGGGGGGTSIGSSGGLFSSPDTSWILVDATNIVNRGGLTVDGNGLIRLRGSSVNLSRSGLRAGVDPFAPLRPGVSLGLSYQNELGITDNHWGVGLNNLLDPAAVGPYDLAVLTGNPANSGPHEVLDASGFTNLVTLPLLSQATNVFAVTNAPSPTNWVIQAVFINTNSTDAAFKIDVKFGAVRDSSVPGGRMPIIRYSFEDVDTITAEPYTNFVYVLDTLGGITNSVLQTNRSTRIDQKPSNFIVTRVTPREWAAATGTNAIFRGDLFYNSTYASQTVTNWYSGYSVDIGEGGGATGGFSFATNIPEVDHPTNKPARIEIEADRLDLSLARFRSEGLLSVKAKELVGTPFKLDATVVNMDLGLSSGSLNVTNLIQPLVRRFNGTVNLYSAIWTNLALIPAPDPATPGSFITNTIEIRCHALIVDHLFATRVPVETYRFVAKAPQVVLSDRVSAVEGFVIDSPNIDIRASLDAQTNVITSASFPSVVNLTNRAQLTTTVALRLGGTTNPVPYFENSGNISGATVDVDAKSALHSGEISSFVGDLTLNVGNLKLEAGSVLSRAHLLINADDFKLTGSRLQAGYEARNLNTGNTNYFNGQLRLNVGTRLTDGGVGASNAITVYDGFHLLRKPSEGDLLGTTITSKVSRFAESYNTWAAADLGAEAAGFSNNSALGRLVLDGRPLSLFTFASATGSKAALYVNHLIFTNYTTNVSLALNISPEFTLYFADSNLNPDQLDGLLDGRLRWVKGYAGAGSSTAVTLSTGRVVMMNRALVASETEDSDNDGVPNALDSAPFEPASLKIAVRLVNEPTKAAEISWAGTPGERYRVEYSHRLEGGEWEGLTSLVNEAVNPGAVSVIDASSDPEKPRFYRVIQDR